MEIGRQMGRLSQFLTRGGYVNASQVRPLAAFACVVLAASVVLADGMRPERLPVAQPDTPATTIAVVQDPVVTPPAAPNVELSLLPPLGQLGSSSAVFERGVQQLIPWLSGSDTPKVVSARAGATVTYTHQTTWTGSSGGGATKGTKPRPSAEPRPLIAEPTPTPGKGNSPGRGPGNDNGSDGDHGNGPAQARGKARS